MHRWWRKKVEQTTSKTVFTRIYCQICPTQSLKFDEWSFKSKLLPICRLISLFFFCLLCPQLFLFFLSSLRILLYLFHTNYNDYRHISLSSCHSKKLGTLFATRSFISNFQETNFRSFHSFQFTMKGKQCRNF